MHNKRFGLYFLLLHSNFYRLQIQRGNMFSSVSVYVLYELDLQTSVFGLQVHRQYI